MRLIDADKLTELRFKGHRDEDGNVLVPLRDVVKAISLAPTVEVEDVVRCKDCKCSDTTTDPIVGDTIRICYYPVRPCPVSDTHYCGYGDRKADAK